MAVPLVTASTWDAGTVRLFRVGATMHLTINARVGTTASGGALATITEAADRPPAGGLWYEGVIFTAGGGTSGQLTIDPDTGVIAATWPSSVAATHYLRSAITWPRAGSVV